MTAEMDWTPVIVAGLGVLVAFLAFLGLLRARLAAQGKTKAVRDMTLTMEVAVLLARAIEQTKLVTEKEVAVDKTTGKIITDIAGESRNRLKDFVIENTETYEQQDVIDEVLACLKTKEVT